MKIQSVFDEGFSAYGRVLEGYDFTQLISVLHESTQCPKDGVIYQPGDAQLEQLEVAAQLQEAFYGGMPIQMGYCNGHNKTLNCLEYHRGSEVDIAADPVILLLADIGDIKEGKLDTAQVEAFELPAGKAVQLFETCLHYAPCTAEEKTGFRVCIVLPKDTNTDKPDIKAVNWEDGLLWARNKWLLAHKDAPEAAQGAYVGLIGDNIVLEG